MQNAARKAPSILRLYYWGTVVFVVFDYVFGINVRLSFLDGWPAMRALYYLALIGCLALIVWRPGLSTLIGTVESLLTLTALILAMGVRVYGMTGEVLAAGAAGLVTLPQLINFLLAGSIAYASWSRGMRALRKDYRV